MTWLKLDAGIASHPKILVLSRMLDDKNAGWWFVKLLCHARINATDGHLDEPEIVEAILGWDGAPGALVRAFEVAGLVEDGEIVGWQHRQRALIEKLQRDRERARARRAKKKEKLADVVEFTDWDGEDFPSDLFGAAVKRSKR